MNYLARKRMPSVAYTPSDLLGAGEFDADSHCDLVATRRGYGEPACWRGDGQGHFEPQAAINTQARITAL